jgi:hypothetical protein
VIVAGVLGTALVTLAVVVPGYGGRSGDLLHSYDAGKRAIVEAELAAKAESAAESRPHTHNDPSTKNLVSRAGATEADAQDPTTTTEKAINATSVAAGRALPSPTLRKVSIARHYATTPRTRYEMAGGCYVLGSAGKWAVRAGDGLALTSGRRDKADRLYFKASDLGSYLLYDTQRQLLSRSDSQLPLPGSGPQATFQDQPTQQGIWRITKHSGRFVLQAGKGAYAAVADDGTVQVLAKPTRFELRKASGCKKFPESQIDIKGAPFGGTTSYEEVRGYVDAHTHGQAWEFLGGGAHCGKPWDALGVTVALVDCPDHQTGVNPLEAFLSGEPAHDPVGWPTFKDWPAPESLTHEGTYYKWLERSWRGGQRLFVNLLVENNQLCQIYPFGPVGTPASKKSSDDMDSLERQAHDMYDLQDYVDAQWGGPGEGWYRIVKTPWQARKVINAGKMAVVMGIETSVPFGCTFKATPGPGGEDHDVPAAVCTPEHIKKQLDLVHGWGVRQMELVNKFDNALAGVAGDNASTGAVVNQANFLETGSYWDMQHCDDADTGIHDKDQYAAPANPISPEQQDALFGAIGTIFGGVALQVYPPPHHCNSRGLTTLGEDTIDGLAQRHMLFDPDHMSVKARQSALDQLEQMKYSGVVSSHSWSTEDAYPRIYKLGGFVAPYAGDSTGFVAKWRKHLGWADPRYYFGFGYGADINGLGAQGDPRGADVPDPVTYPFTGFGGVRVGKQHAGQRVYDINVDGVAQYGLYPDWMQDLKMIANTQKGDGQALMTDMSRGAEAYLQTWERAYGIAPDSCRNPALRKPVSKVRDLLRPGLTTRQVMARVGQPYTRVDHTFGVCARRGSDRRVQVTLTFDGAGRLQRMAV